MLAAYILSLGASAGLAGLFVRQVFEGQGYVPGFRTGLLLAAGSACLYVSLQAFYMAVVRTLKPTRDWPLLITESLSHAAALLLLPYVLNVEVQWPHPLLDKAEPVVFLGAFAFLHGLLKLVSFYAALRGRPSSRWGALGWATACAMTAVVGRETLVAWLRETEAARPQAPHAQAPYCVGGAYALACEMPEGSVMEAPLEPYPGQCVTLRFADVPPNENETEPLGRIYTTVSLHGEDTKRFSASVDLDRARWSEIRVPAEAFPAGCTACTITWTSQRPPGWRRVVGLRSVATSNRKVLVAGPFEHEQRTPDTPDPNFIILVAEGLSARHVSCLGYKRETTPCIDRDLAPSAHTFSNAYAPAPASAPSAMTLLTGLDPLTHGYLENRTGPLPVKCQTLPEILRQDRYATAAFVEAAAPNSGAYDFGNGFERGFELFDTGCGSAGAENDKPCVGAGVTLEKVQQWIDEQADIKFAVFVRLFEPGPPMCRESYLPGFVKEQDEPQLVDVYDSAVAYVDRHLGELVRHVRERHAHKPAGIVLTSTYGFDAVSGAPAGAADALTDGALHVPLFVYLPYLGKAARRELVALEDVAPTLARLAGIGFPTPVNGHNFLDPAFFSEPVSMCGDPAALSIRTEKWRFTCQTRWKYWDGKAGVIGETAALYDVKQLKRKGPARNVAAQYPRVTEEFATRLGEYIRKRAPQNEL